ncbi:MAG: hypothetical protein ACLUGJ_13050 [Blautia wexlerae]
MRTVFLIRKAVLGRSSGRRAQTVLRRDDRAKKKLVLAWVKRQYEKEREPSRFLEETGL